MGSLLRQIIAAVSLNLQSIPQRPGQSLSTVLTIGLVVGVLLGFLAMANGFQRTLQGTGSDDVAIVLRSGAEAELNSFVSRDQTRILAETPVVARTASDVPIASPELFVIVDAVKISSGNEVNLSLRGVEPIATEVRDGFQIVEGRMFDPGANELIVGASVLEEFTGFELGTVKRFGTTEWTVVGVFAVPGTVFDSEIWADLPMVQNLFRRGSGAQVVRLRLTSPEAIEELRATLEADPRLNLEVRSEADYYAAQSGNTNDLIMTLGWPIAITMALGALAGALNAMFSSVEARTREIATLRAIGFGGFPAFIGTMVESLLLAAIGGLIGAAAAYGIFNGLSASTLGGGFTQVVFNFSVTPAVILNGLVLALVVGFFGGVAPAIRAARAPLLAVH